MGPETMLILLTNMFLWSSTSKALKHIYGMNKVDGFIFRFYFFPPSHPRSFQVQVLASNLMIFPARELFDIKLSAPILLQRCI